jgi:CHAT domain-containing protein
VTAAPAGADNDPAALRATPWFGDAHALIHIPSLQSLALLRRSPPAEKRGSFIGVGDPVLSGGAGARTRGAASAVPATARLFRSGRTRGGGLIADAAELRRMARLPGTAFELEAVRKALGAERSSLIMAERATEPNVRGADLTKANILLFATHGLTAQEALGVGESGLVLTPPPAGEERDGDDGYLSASEVATLRLNAEWVILSACNTAAGDGTGNAGLGELARAFFFAGARNLLASHWPVSDEVAPVLIPRILALQEAGKPGADAVQQAVREIRSNPATPDWAHPFFWAPFVLIGGGA